MTKPTGRPRGRPKGSKSKPRLSLVPTTEVYARVERMEAEGVKLSPLDIMLLNMDWAWSKIAPVLQEIAEDKSNSPEVRLNAIKEAQMLRDRVQNYAKDAAVYVHGKPLPVPPMVTQNDIIEIDPLREHLAEMARVFKLKATNGHAA